MYSFLSAIAAALAFAVAAVCLAPTAFVSGIAIVRRRLGLVAIFLVTLVTLGLVSNAAWMLLFPGRLYVDRDLLFGFSPLLPFTLDQACDGHLLPGVSYTMMHGLWLVFAIATWTAAAKITRRLTYERAA